ncbi:MAG: phosphatase PAP2 family protein [Candidatus Micrarchaeia archaeon]
MQTIALDFSASLAAAFSPAAAFHDSFYLILVAFTILALLFIKAENKLPLLLALFLSVTMIPVLKAAYNEPRPCSGLDSCPPDAGFPSGHSSLAAIYAVAGLGTLSFYFFLPAGIAIAVSRVASNEHTWPQVAGGVATGLILFFVSKTAVDSAMDFAAKRGLLPKKRGILTNWQARRASKKTRAGAKK